MNTPFSPEKFLDSLDKAIAFHHRNQDDPYNLKNGAILCLSEVRNAFASAVGITHAPPYKDKP